ncbi:MAG TPA: AMIN domain-containing protein [Terriglobales bacterium]|nr:AMIN domain-containing protein [Terriglobales bacterium]
MPAFGPQFGVSFLLVSVLAVAPCMSGQVSAPRPAQPPPQSTTAPTAGGSNPVPAPGTAPADAPSRRTRPEFGPWESGPITGISNASGRPATLRSVTVVTDQDGPAVQILTTHPVIPSIRALDGPPRLIIDLPNSSIGTLERRTSIQRDQVTSLRIDQFREDPPLARVVVDLVEARAFTWDAAGNRLMVRLKPPAPPAPPQLVPAPAPAPTPSVTSYTSAPPPAVIPVSSGGGGSIVMAGTRVANGSSITTGPDPTVLSITRGGEILVCPRTTLAVTASKSGRELMVSMNTGAMEAHYRLDASADSVFTPDFRILLAGPGEFHYAVSSDSQGDTCVRTLEGNTASAIVSELMGNRTYQVKPTEQVLFRKGHIDQVQADVPVDCGCPRPREPVMLASLPRPEPISDASLPSNVRLSTSNPSAPLANQPAKGPGDAQSPVQFSSGGRETAPLPPGKPGETHIQVEAPFVFRATDPVPGQQAKNSPTGSVPPNQTVHPSAGPEPASPAPKDQPAPSTSGAQSNQHRGFFGKVKGFFSGIFR